MTALSKAIPAVTSAFGIHRDAILSPCRERDVVRARFAVIWLMYRDGRLSLPQIGRAISRDHTSVLSARRRVDVLRDTDADFARRLAMAEALFDATGPVDDVALRCVRALARGVPAGALDRVAVALGVAVREVK